MSISTFLKNWINFLFYWGIIDIILYSFQVYNIMILYLYILWSKSQTVKRLSTMRETWVRSLDQEDSLEKEMAIHYNFLDWKIPWTEEAGGLQSMELQRLRLDWACTHIPIKHLENTLCKVTVENKKKKIEKNLIRQSLKHM